METKTITINRKSEIDIVDFAQDHNLEIEINERDYAESDPHLFYARIRRGEVKDGIVLSVVTGQANSPFEALGKLAQALSFQILVIDATSKTIRREIVVPRLFVRRDSFLRSIKDGTDA